MPVARHSSPSRGFDDIHSVINLSGAALNPCQKIAVLVFVEGIDAQFLIAVRAKSLRRGKRQVELKDILE